MTLKRMITAVDTHSGIPMRVITGGVDHIPGASVLDKVRVRPRSWPPGPTSRTACIASSKSWGLQHKAAIPGRAATRCS